MFKNFALAAVLSIAAVSGAYAAPAADSLVFPTSNVSKSTIWSDKFTASSGSYDLLFSFVNATLFRSPTLAEVGFKLTDTTGPNVTIGTYTIDLLTYGSTSLNQTITGLNVGDVYKLSLVTKATSGNFDVTGLNGSIAPTPMAAPGPIAGAGLPVVLGMMGFAAWRRRKAVAA